MIPNAVVSGFASFLNFILGFFPTPRSDYLTFISEHASDLRSYATSASWIFPVNYFLALLSAVITIEITIMIINIYRWIARSLASGHF